MEKDNKMPIFFPPHLLQEKPKTKDIIHKKNNNIIKPTFNSNNKGKTMFRMKLQ